MAITLNHTEVAYLRKKLGLSAREMPALHCALRVLIVEYQDKFKRLPPMDYLKSANLDYCARDMVDGIAWSGEKNWVEHPSARELRAAYYKDKSSED